MDFRNLVSLSCQQKNQCPILLKFELLITLQLLIQDNSFSLIVTTQILVKFICGGHFPCDGLGIQDATC
jgi:hypothetical protein